jgi:hypothetical protein
VGETKAGSVQSAYVGCSTFGGVPPAPQKKKKKKMMMMMMKKKKKNKNLEEATCFGFQEAIIRPSVK